MTGTTITGTHSSGYELNNAATQNPATVAAGATISAAGIALYGAVGTAWTVTNYGTVQGTGAGSAGVALFGGGVITNTSTGHMTAYTDGVYVKGGTGTVTNTGSITGTGTAGSGIVLVTGGAVTNQALGVISGNSTAGAGVVLSNGGAVDNQQKGTISGSVGVFAASTAASVVNQGSIHGSIDAVYLSSGGTLSNQSGGIISGGTYGVKTNGTAASWIVNQGLITSPTKAAIGLLSGGYVSNAGTGVISGSKYGIEAFNDAATIVNAGGITAQSIDGVILFAGGTLSNAGSGTIQGAHYGVLVFNTAASVFNQGLITSPTNAAVGMLAGGYLGNAGTGVITGSGYGIKAANDPVTIVNAGSITGQSIDSVVLFNGGTVSNTGSGAILGEQYGVLGLTIAATVFNQGTIRGTEVAGIQLREGGYVSNAATGTITGAYFGVQILTISASVANFGSISSSAVYPVGDRGFDAAGVDLAAGGIVSNGTAGDIRATWKGVEIGAVGTNVGGTVLNQGTIYASNSLGDTGAAVWIHGPGLISNAASGTIDGGPYGIVAYYQTTLVNLGSVGGTVFAFDPVNPGFADRVVVAPGAIFSGTVSGGNTIGASVVSTLELASGAASGTLSGLGTTFVDFGETTIDSGASWTLNNSNTVVHGATLTNSGGLTLAGTFMNAGSIYAGAGLQLASGVLFTNAAGGVITGYTNAVNVPDAIGTLTNAGTIALTGTSGSAIVLSAAGDTVTNAATGVISGVYAGLEFFGAAGTVINQGSIGASGTIGTGGVDLRDGGAVTNMATASISGVDSGIVVSTAAGTVVNGGTIVGSGSLASGVNLFGGSVTNGTHASIYGGRFGVLLGNAGTVVNLGSIGGARYDGVLLTAGGTVTNAGTATISSGNGTGVDIEGDAGTVSNAGTVSASSVGVVLNAGGLVSNASGGLITAGNAGVSLDGGTLINQGSIAATSTRGSGVGLDSGTVSNQSGGTITGGSAGIYGSGTANAVVNASMIQGITGAGVALVSGGAVTNQGTATIAGSPQGIYVRDGAGTVVNASLVTASGAGSTAVDLTAGGAVTNQGTATIAGAATGIGINTTAGMVVNAGTIAGTSFAGIALGAGGMVTNMAGGAIVGGDYGVRIFGGAGTVVNAGSIAGTGSRSVLLGSGTANRLVVDPGAVFNGTVDGGNAPGATAVSTLELASGATAGTLTGFGTKYIDFSQITIDAGATWTVASGDVPAGSTITDLGTLINEGTMAAPVTVAAGGSFTNASGATIVGSGTAAVYAGAGATVVNAGVIDPANYGVYLPAGGTVTNISGGTIVGTVAGVKVTGAAGTVVNAGSIYGTGAPSYGVELTAGGTVSNGAGGATTALIQGYLEGVLSTGTYSAQISNFATISATGGVAGGYGIRVGGAGTVSNIGTASLIEGNGGISIGQNGTVSNAGTIATLLDGYSAVTIGGAGYVSNLGTASLIDGWGGVSIDGSGTVTNAGTIFVSATGGTYFGVDIQGAGSVSNAGTASLIEGYSGGVSIGGPGIVSNAGTIEVSGTFLLAYGVGIGGAGSVINSGTASLIEGDGGVSIGGAGSVSNAGTIVATATGPGGVGVVLGTGGSVTNSAGATIAATVTGVQVSGAAGTIVNAGSIYATGAGSAGVGLIGGGAVTNQSGGTIDGALYGVGSSNFAIVTNSGRIGVTADVGVGISGGEIVNAATGEIAGTGSGVRIYVGGTVVDAGTISGGGDAVYFHSGFTNRLVVDPGAVFNGVVEGGNTLGATAVSTLELASGASAGTLTGLGRTIDHFGSIVIDSGATWTLAADSLISTALTAGYSIFDAGTLTNTGTLSNAGTDAPTVVLGPNAVLINAQGATIAGYPAPVYARSGAGTVFNAGLLTSGDTSGRNGGVAMAAGGFVSNAQSGIITGGGVGIYIGDAANSLANGGTVLNSGSIGGLGTVVNAEANGAELDSGGLVSNASSGIITGTHNGVQIRVASTAQSALVVNQGLIENTGASANSGINLQDGGSVSNSGTVLGTQHGVYFGASGAAGGVVLNTGFIAASGSYTAVDFTRAGLLTNAGIIGAATATGDAVSFASGYANRLIVDPGAVFNGTVDGGNTLGATAVSTLELAPGASAGVLNGLGAHYINFYQVTVDAGAAWSLTNSSAPIGETTLTDSGTVTIGSALAPGEIGFAGTAAFVKLDDPEAFTGGMYGFGRGDMLDIGPATVGSIIQQYGPDGGPPVLTVLSNTGGTLFSAAFSGAYGGAVGNDTGTYAVNTLTSGAVVAGPYELLTQNGDTVLEELPPSTWRWTGADPSNIEDPANWTLVSGPGNEDGGPDPGDTVFVNNGTLALPLDSTLNDNTIYLTGTSEMNFVGDQTGISNGKAGISYQNPTVDGESLITNDPAVSPADTTLNFAGYTVNQGMLVSDGSEGSSLTLNVTQDGTAPGYFLNYGGIEADTGNTVTIAIAGTSELFNVNLIYANGGTVAIDGGTGIAGGYAPMLGGIALIGDGGTLVYNAGFPSGTEGSTPVFAFYDDASGNTLKLEQLGQFTGRILGFQQGDTIDLGGTLSIGTIVVTADGRLLLEGGGTVDTLTLSSGAYNIGTHAVTAVSAGTFAADGFTLTTGADGDTLLTTGVVDDVWNDTSGIWQTATAWSGNVVPGTISAAIIGYNTAGADGTLAPFVLTTGSVAVDVNSLAEVSDSATLQITSNTTVGTSTNEYPIQQIAGEIEVTGGNTLTAAELKQSSPGADLQIDAGGVLDLTGHSDLGFVNDGTLSEFTVVNGATFANGNSLALFVMGNATVDGGTIDAGPVLNGANVVSTGGLISIGQDGGATPATMTVENGATVTDTYGFLSSDPTSFGSLTLTGAGTTWDDESDPTDTYNTRGYMIVGDDNQAGNQPSPTPSGTAQLLVENNAALNEYSHAEIGVSADSAGSATITAGGVWNIGTSGASGGVGGFMNVGNSGSGTLVIDNDGTVNILAGTGTFVSDGTVITSAAGMGIAHSIGGDGTVDVSGGGELNLTISSTISGGGLGVGQLGHGVLDIFNGGTVSITGGGFSAGSDSTVIAVGTTVAGDGTILVGGTFDPDGSVDTTGGASAVLMASGNGAAIGKAGTGTLYVETGGTVQVSGGGITVGDSAGAYGLAVINGGLVKDTTNGLNVGGSGTGTLELVNGGTVSLTGGGIDIGESADSQGLLEIASGGMLTSTTNGMEIGVVAGASGTLDVLDGGIYNISTHGLSDGFAAGATGTILVDGTTSLINIATTDSGYAFTVGQSGTGDLTVQNGGSVLSGIGLNVGQAAGATGTVTVTGGGTLSTGGTSGINVGDTGSGMLTIGVGLETLGVGDTVSAAGTVYASNFFDIAVGGTATTGAVVVNGGTLYDNGIFNVANTGTGTLVVEGGGLVDQTGINFNIGSNSGSRGGVTVNGGTLITNGGLQIGGTNAQGLLTVSSGSVAATGVNIGPNGTVSVGGGTAEALFSDSGRFVVGNSGTNALLSIGSLGVVTGTSANTLQIGGIGSSAGTVTVNGGTIDPFGGFEVDNGLMSVTAGGQVTVSGSGTLSGSGIGSSFGNGTLIVNGGTVSESGASFSIGGNDTSGSLLVENGGLLTTTTIASQFAQISLGASSGGTAVATIDGGTWDVNGPLAIAPGPGTNDVGSLDVRGNGVLDGVVNAGTNAIRVATQSSTSGTVTVESGGTLIGGALTLSNTTTGTASGLLAVGAGGTVALGGLLQEGAGGTITVGGGMAEAVLSSTASMVIGVAGSTAVMTVGSLGVVSAGSAGYLQVGDSTGGVLVNGTLTGATQTIGSVTVDSGGTVDGTGALEILNGALTVNSGGQAIFSNTTLASNIGIGQGSNGTLIVNGGTVSETGPGFAIGGFNGSGSVLVEAGGLLTTTANGGQFPEAGFFDASGTGSAIATVSGGTWDANGALGFGTNIDGTGSLDINNLGVVNAGTNTIVLGSQTLSTGTISVEDGGTLVGGAMSIANGPTASGLLAVGSGGTVELGSLTEGGGGTVTVAGNNHAALLSVSGAVDIGDTTGGALLSVGGNGTVEAGSVTADYGGTITVGGGTVEALLSTSGALAVGNFGAGTLYVTSNGTVEAGSLSETNASTIDVTGGLLSVSAALDIGVQGTGATLIDDGTVSDTSVLGSVAIGIGASGAATGDVQINGGALSYAGGLVVGTGATGSSGTLTVSNGTLSGTGTGGATLGYIAGTSGTVDIAGGVWTENGTLVVGNSGSGVLEITEGLGATAGVVNIGSNTVVIGGQPGGTGTVTVGLGGSLQAGDLQIGNGGTGLLTVNLGGSLIASDGVQFQGAESSELLVNGGSATVSGGISIGSGLLEVENGGVLTGDSSTQASNVGGGGPGQSGTLIVDGGTVSDTAAFFTVGGGSGASGTLIVDGGGLLTTSSDGNTAGQIDGASGDAIATVNDGTWDVNGYLIVGNNAGDTGTLDINNGLVNAGTNGITIANLSSSSGTVTVGSGGTLVGAGLTMADQSGTTGTLTVSSGGTVELGYIADGGGAIDVTGGLLSVTGDTTIGQSEGGATLTLQSGSVDTQELYIGNGTGATGTVTVSGGVLDATNQVQIGNQGDGLLEVDTGGSVDATGGLQVDSFGTGNGTVIVNGGTLTDSDGFSIGNGGSTGIAGVTVEAGGLLSVTGNNQFVIGSSGGTAEVVVSGGTLTTSGSSLQISDSGGSASLLVDNGGTVVTTFTGVGPAADINASSGAHASVTVAGAGSVWDIDGASGDQLAVGDSGTGSLTVSDGGVVNAGTNAVVIGNQNSGSGYVDVSGGGALLEGGSVSVGPGASSSTLEVDTGGTVNVAGAALINQNASVFLSGGMLDANSVGLSSSAMITGFGTLDTFLLFNSGEVTAANGMLEVTGPVESTGAMTIAAGATLDLLGTVFSGQTIDFTANSGVLQIGSIGFSGTIGSNLSGDIQPGDTIIINGVTDATSVNVVGANTLQIVSTSLGNIDLQLDPEQGFLGDYFHVNTVGGNAVVTENNVPCYLAGTRILTDRGEVLVEMLRIGDRVVTLDGGKKPIKWIGRRSYSGAIPTGQRDVIPILIRQGALGEGLPKRDLIVSPLHAMYCDGVLVPAEHLVNGVTVLRAPDIDPIRYFHIELDQHDVIYADGAPAETFVDCDSRAIFHNAAEFDALYPGDATPHWRYCAPRIEGGERLDAIKRAIDRRAGIALPEPGAPPGRLEGRLDGIEGGRIAGWAFHPDRPEAPVWLEVLDGDGVIARVHARRYRADLEEAGVGDGRHGFELHLTGQMRTRREIHVRRVEDGAELEGSPLLIEARGAQALLEDARRVLAEAILDPVDEATLDTLAEELLHGVDALRQARAALAGLAKGTPPSVTARSALPSVIARSEATRQSPAGLGREADQAASATGLATTPKGKHRRALIIDAQLPRPERDAGSQAILSHAAALASLGFQVEFVAAHELARAEPASLALEQAGYVVHRAPHVASVEEVLRRHRNAFDVVYLHRLANAEAYAPLARAWQTRARLLYCVADLHHVRLARQAAVQASAEVAEDARGMRVRELNAMRLCDAVITHSTAEAAYLARVAPGASVHVVAWTPSARPRKMPLAARHGVAAIGSWSHEPNVDAVRWLMSDIMPLVWQAAPDIELLVVGSGWPVRVPWITDSRVRLVGEVTSIETLLSIPRLSVAPLRFGAGLKGKVLDSFACKVPCVMSPIAAEGFPLDGALSGLVGEDAAALASLIVRLHEEPPFHRDAARDGLALAAKFSAEVVRSAMAAAVGLREAGTQARPVALVEAVGQD